MKVLILNTSERTGGAAVAANRLMKALCKQGVEAKMLVRDKQSADERITSVNQSLWQRRLSSTESNSSGFLSPIREWTLSVIPW